MMVQPKLESISTFSRSTLLFLFLTLFLFPGIYSVWHYWSPITKLLSTYTVGVDFHLWEHFAKLLRQYVFADDTLMSSACAIIGNVCFLVRMIKTSRSLELRESYVSCAAICNHRCSGGIKPDLKIASFTLYSSAWSIAASSRSASRSVRFGQSIGLNVTLCSVYKK